MRKEPTQAERILWDVLRNRKFHGLKFRRQVPVDRYIADFLCLEKKVIIELDGPLHDEEHDRQRDKVLESAGFIVLRFKNEDFINNFGTVMERLEFFAKPNA
jgi:very-short-patch-repair endonuclease